MTGAPATALGIAGRPIPQLLIFDISKDINASDHI
jgi:hypothetical protein